MLLFWETNYKQHDVTLSINSAVSASHPDIVDGTENERKLRKKLEDVYQHAQDYLWLMEIEMRVKGRDEGEQGHDHSTLEESRLL